MMNKFIFFAIGIFVFLISFQTEARACRCIVDANQTLEQRVNSNLETAKVIFAGKVVEITKIDAYKTVVTMEVEESWKESLPKELVVSTYPTNCGFEFKKGTSYLIFAEPSETGELQTSKCFPNKEISNAAEELKILGEGKTANVICPSLFISKSFPSNSKTVIFNLKMENAAPYHNLTYDWEYSIGSKNSPIKSGQGTSSITVEDYDLEQGMFIKVIIGGLPTGCEDRTAMHMIS